MERSKRSSKTIVEDLVGETSVQDHPKIRKCLKCQAEFESAWSGERICKKCKGSNSWKSNGY